MGNKPAFPQLGMPLSSRKAPKCSSICACCHPVPSLGAMSHLGVLPTSHQEGEDINSLIRCQDLHKQKKVKESSVAEFTLRDLEGGARAGPEALAASPLPHTFGLGWLFFLTVSGVKTDRT